MCWTVGLPDVPPPPKEAWSPTGRRATATLWLVRHREAEPTAGWKKVLSRRIVRARDDGALSADVGRPLDKQISTVIDEEVPDRLRLGTSSGNRVMTPVDSDVPRGRVVLHGPHGRSTASAVACRRLRGGAGRVGPREAIRETAWSDTGTRRQSA
jgi:hypothetical protein